MIDLSYTAIVQAATRHNLSLLSISNDCSALGDEEVFLKNWQNDGYSAEMGYMQRDAAGFCEPKRLLEPVKSIISLGIWYGVPSLEETRQNCGRIARYAWGRDYHKVLKKRLTHFVEDLEQEYGNFPFRFASDAVPLLERAIAVRNGLGFIGQNSMLIRPRSGSFFFLAELLLGVNVTGVEDNPSNGGCGKCSRCLNSCAALVNPYTVDAGSCRAYLTIEKRGALTISERRKIGNWIFGCDACQIVCPYNKAALLEQRKADFDEFNADGFDGFIDLADILKIRSQEEFLARFAGQPIMRAKREGLLRNAACVAANMRYVDLHGVLLCAATEDESDLVRGTALWSLGELYPDLDKKTKNLIKMLVQRYKSTEDCLCAREAKQLANCL